jgi:hypothetical protein
MMLLERWVVATVLGITMPLVSTAAGSSAPQQAGAAQPEKTEQNRAKAADGQDPQAANADDDQDDKLGTSAYDRDTPPEDQDPAKAGVDHPVMPAQGGDDQDAKPAISAYDRDTPSADQNPAKAGGVDQNNQNLSKAVDKQDAKPAKVAEDQVALPDKTGDGLSPAKAPEHAVTWFAATPAQAEQQQLQKDSATLLQLVQELKAEVEKAGNNTLSLAALRKADEIQRLAKNLKEKMREQGQTSQNKP